MKLSLIAGTLGCDINDDIAETDIVRISSLDSADERSISFISDAKFYSSAEKCKAPVMIVKKGFPVKDKINLEVNDPYLGYAQVALLFEDKTPVFPPENHSTAIIDTTARIADNSNIGPGCVIGSDVIIGQRTIVGANCVIEKNSIIGDDCRIDSGVIIRYNTHIGNRSIIQSGTVIGSDGFANAMDKGTFVRIPCFGNVVIEDDVHIGAGVTIDRGNFEPTVIRTGARLDNLIHIAHNVTVGKHTAMAAQTGVSGSTRIGNNVLIGGQAGFVGHITIGDRAFIGAKAGVSKSVPEGAKITGYPARDFMRMRRIEAVQQDLPGMAKEIKSLQKRIASLEKQLSREK